MQTVQFMDFVQVLLDCSAKMNVRMLSAVAVFFCSPSILLFHFVHRLHHLRLFLF